MRYRRSRVGHEKPVQDRLAEEQRLKGETEVDTRNSNVVSFPDHRSEGTPLDEIFGTEEGAPGEQIAGHPNSKPQILLSEKIVGAAGVVAAILMGLFLLIGT